MNIIRHQLTPIKTPLEEWCLLAWAIFNSTETIMEDWDVYQRARKRAEGKLAFYIHLAIYLVVSTLLLSRNLGSAPQYPWAHWPILGWGIGVIFHAAVIYVVRGSSFITDRMIERELRLSRTDHEKLHIEL